MTQYQIPKGLFDILPYGTKEEWRLSSHWQYVESVMRKVAADYGFQEIRTPIFERTELFCRSVGESSDIVSKEMYTFLDKANRSMSLRPEGTAAVMRAFIEENLLASGHVHKLYYISSMFRYDRPQAGRYRQHHQFGVEYLGIGSLEQEVETIDLLSELYRRLKIQNFSFLINSVGDEESRQNYRASLKKYLLPFLNDLSKESRERFEKNPLRILDSKDPKDIEILKKAPSLLQSLTSSAKEHFDKVLHLLDKLKIPFSINEKLVRGLDYYTHTIFEVVSKKSGSQSSLGGGGRYDNLLASLGGSSLPGIGFGTGLERILQTMLEQEIPFPEPTRPLAFFIPLDEASREKAFLLSSQLRHLFIPTEIDLQSKKIQKALQNADKKGAHFSIIIGDEELKSGKLQLKNMRTHEQKEFSEEALLTHLKELWRKSSSAS